MSVNVTGSETLQRNKFSCVNFVQQTARFLIFLGSCGLNVIRKGGREGGRTNIKEKIILTQVLMHLTLLSIKTRRGKAGPDLLLQHCSSESRSFFLPKEITVHDFKDNGNRT